MKRYKVINKYSPAHGIIIETGSIVHLSEHRANSGKRFISEEELEKKTKSKKSKIEEYGSNSITP